MFLPEVKSKIGEDISILIKLDNHSENLAQATLNFHSYATASGQIMRRCQVKKAIPIHFSRRYDVQEVEVLKTEFTVAYQG